jgi:dynein heavy chain
MELPELNVEKVT